MFRKTSTFNLVFSNPKFLFTLVVIFAITLYFSKLGGNGLANYDDCYYAQKAKEILQTGDWITLHYNNLPIFDNPPFFMWLVAVSYKIFGITEYAAKFPSALMGVLSIILTYFLARHFFGHWIGFFSGFILAITPTFSKYTRHAMVDVPLSFFVCLALFSLILAQKKNKWYFIVWGVSIAICILTKSVLGFFPLVISVLYLLYTEEFKIFISSEFLFGVFIALILGCFWYVHQYMNFGQEFLDVHFGWLILERGFLKEAEPWYAHLSYFKDLLTYYWPWLPFFAFGMIVIVKKARNRDKASILLLIWIFSYLVIMSVMQSRKIWYIMPIFPAAAIISAFVINRLLTENGKLVFAKFVFAIALFANIIVNATPIQIESNREVDIRIFAPYVRHFGNQGVSIIGYKLTYHGINNALLFYSDFAVDPIYDKDAELRKIFSSEAPVLCIVDSRVADELRNAKIPFFVIKEAEKKLLISNRDLRENSVRIW